MKKTAIILFIVLLSLHVSAQIAPQKYFIEFTDKDNSPYSIDRPEEFLSPRALERRQNQSIPIDYYDIPVNDSYVNAVRNYGVTILNRSKWLNGITLFCDNPSLITAISQLPFVQSIKRCNNIKCLYSNNKFSLEEVILEEDVYFSQSTFVNSKVAYNYGPSFRQTEMLNGDSMHRMGYNGAGKVIAVLDAGFFNADILPAFDSLWENNQIIGTKDFVKPGNNVFLENEHGMEVLSTIGGNLPGLLIGTAPKAKFWLFRTEEKASENIIEEYNWVSAAEFADSAGVDIINSSLGYTQFDDTTYNHTCNDMNGDGTPVTKGANIAATRGMIVVNSAGNSGGSSWKCVSAPADGYTVVAVAAVDSNGNRALFSSVGEATRRIKPNVAAMGAQTVMSSPNGTITRRSGTSFSSPLIAGMVACLWQAAPSWSNTSIIRSIELSSSQISNPDSLLGYGIPDFPKALLHLIAPPDNIPPALHAFPNPFRESLTITRSGINNPTVDIQIIDLLGCIRFSRVNQTVGVDKSAFHLDNLTNLPAGSYLLKVVTGESVQVCKLIKQ